MENKYLFLTKWSFLGIPCPDLYFSGAVNEALAFVTLRDVLQNYVLFSEA